MRSRGLLLLVLLAGCGGPERRSGGPSSAGPEHAGATGRTRPGGAAAPEAQAAAPEDEAVPEAPAGSVTSFDVEAVAAKLAAAVRAKRAALGPEPVVGDVRISNRSGNTRVDGALIQALVVKALLDEQVAVKVWRGLEVPGGFDMDALQRERKSSVALQGEISRERMQTEGEGAKVTLTYQLQLTDKLDRTTLATATTTIVRVQADEPRSDGPPGPPGQVDLSAAIAAGVRAVAAAKPAGVDVLAAENHTRRQLPDLGPELASRLVAAGVPATARREEAPEEEATERGYEDAAAGGAPTGPRRTHTLVSQLFEESWTSPDGERYRSVLAVFLLVDTAAREVTLVSVTRVRG